MKHAYLILAHTDFKVLERLVSLIDDSRNDIYIHFDSKVKELPDLKTSHSILYIISKRVNVHWGDFSVVEAEYELFKEALQNGGYSYYHLLSGADLPLKSQDYIHEFFKINAGKEFIGYTLTSVTPELVRKTKRWHLFPHDFKNTNTAKRMVRAAFIRFQEIFNLVRNRKVDFKKGSQWVSVTETMARCFVNNIAWARKVFTHTFCPDEIVFQTLCWHTPNKENIYSLKDDATGCMRAISWEKGQMLCWSKEDYEKLKESEYLFARKFTSDSL